MTPFDALLREIGVIAPKPVPRVPERGWTPAYPGEQPPF